MSYTKKENYFHKAKEFDLLSQYYKYTNPELYIKYYYQHLHYMDQYRLQSTQNNQNSYGKIRLFHAVQSVKNIDLYINETRIFKDIPSKSVSNYLSLPEGKYQIDLYPSGQLHNVLLSRKVDIKEGIPYTIVASGNTKKLSLFLLEENHFLPTQETKLNCLNLNPESPGIDIAVTGGDTIFSNLSYKKPSPYLGLTPMTLEFSLKCSKSKHLLLNPFSATLHPNQIYTMAIISSGIDHENPEIIFI